MARTEALTLAQIVDWLTRSQLRRLLGALPVLYALLETLQVREIINHHRPTAADVDHGTVALVLILNRLMAPRPLYQVADWLARTVLACTLGVPAAKTSASSVEPFNDDRRARTLDAISQLSRDTWRDVVHRKLVRAKIDLSFIFHDLTAFAVHGEYAGSQHADFGFAHNTPMDKREFKAGLDVAADGNIPTEYTLWPGRTADLATVQENMERLCRPLRSHGWLVEEVTIIGDRANLNDEPALVAYDDHGLHYLAGLQPHKKRHRKLLAAVPERQFYTHPLTDQRGAERYWGVLCQVVFEHEGRQALAEVEAKIGQLCYRTVETVQRRADTQVKGSPVGKLMRVEAYTDDQGQVCQRWWIGRYALWQAM